MEHSLSSFAAIAGCVETARSQRGVLSAELSLDVINMGRSFPMVLGVPAIVIALEDYNLTLKIMKTGPVNALKEVKMEGEKNEDDAQPAEVVPPMSAKEVPVEDQGDSVMEDTSMVDDDATKAPDDMADASLPSETEADPVATKKRQAAEALGEVLGLADSMKVCPICWVDHPNKICPRLKESEELIQTLLYANWGESPIEVEAKDDAEPDDVVKDAEETVQGDGNIEMTTDQDADLSANLIGIDQQPFQLSSPSRSHGQLPCFKSPGMFREQPRQVTFPTVAAVTSLLLWVRPRSQSRTRSQTCKISRTRCLNSWSILSQDKGATL